MLCKDKRFLICSFNLSTFAIFKNTHHCKCYVVLCAWKHVSTIICIVPAMFVFICPCDFMLTVYSLI